MEVTRLRRVLDLVFLPAVWLQDSEELVELCDDLRVDQILESVLLLLEPLEKVQGKQDESGGVV